MDVKYEIFFYKDKHQNEPAKEWLKKLPNSKFIDIASFLFILQQTGIENYGIVVIENLGGTLYQFSLETISKTLNLYLTQRKKQIIMLSGETLVHGKLHTGEGINAAMDQISLVNENEENNNLSFIGQSLNDLLLSFNSDYSSLIKAEAVKIKLVYDAKIRMAELDIDTEILKKRMNVSESHVTSILDHYHTGTSLFQIINLYTALGIDLNINLPVPKPLSNTQSN